MADVSQSPLHTGHFLAALNWRSPIASIASRLVEIASVLIGPARL